MPVQDGRQRLGPRKFEYVLEARARHLATRPMRALATSETGSLERWDGSHTSHPFGTSDGALRKVPIFGEARLTP